ncbi:MAG: nucleotidyltransferase family protein [Leptolyngbyaceae cyanobacterium bins.302]|nr:nucleotidyltransferase family protein [Leptolyngbyaceae cyanobacterium bins.302]
MNSTTLPIPLPYESIAEFCQKNSIRKLSLFGSILREDFHENSDIDMLVEFKPNHTFGYFELVKMELELTTIIGRKVDLRTAGEISRYFRQQVIDSAQPVYVFG